MALHGKSTLAAIQRGADNFEPFHIGNISGRTTSSGTGRLTGEPLAIFKRDESVGLEYVFYSYDTPIAWKAKGLTWVIIDVRYSPSTSGHQGRVSVAIRNRGFWLR